MKKKLSVLLTVFLLATMVVGAGAQGVSYDNPWNTSYQIANLGNESATITVDYYDAAGNAQSGAQRNFPDVPAGGSVTIQQALEETLGEGVFSAVVSADQQIAAVANQQTDPGTGSSQPPFSSYSGASQGATELIIPAVMYNWFGYYTEIIIQNVGDADATDIDIEYFPTTFGAGCQAGAAGVTDVDNDLAQYASVNKSQLEMSSLGASGLTGDCEYLNDRFLGSAKITADQPIVAVANQHVQGKLFTYNGQGEGATELLLPAYMRNYYGYYAAMVIANPGDADAIVDVTYSNGDLGTSPTGQEVVTEQVTVPAGESVTIYDGETGTDTALANAGYDYGSQYQFFGTAKVESNVPVVAMVNQEAVADSGAQAGTYNGMAVAEGESKISVPLIQSDFYGYYTSLTIMTVDGEEASFTITYTSDDQFSSVQGNSESYDHTTTGGFLNVYEGPGSVNADILGDAVWQDAEGTGRFIGSAVIEVTTGSNIVAFVNSEQSVGGADSMYTYNAFPMQ
jgi:hypothetical protein